MWEELEREKASKRQAISGSQNLGLVMEHVPQLEEKGKSRDIIVDKVGLGSGRTYDRAKTVSNKIEEAI